MAPLNAANRRTGDAPNAYVFALGAYGWTRLLVFASSLEAAVEEIGPWAAEHAKGLLCDEQVSQEYLRLRDEWTEAHPGQEPSDDEVEEFQNEAEVDTTHIGDDHRILSWEWVVALDGAGPRELGDFVRESRRYRPF